MSYPLPTCDTEGCPGHLGKFDSCVAEALYEWSMDGTANDVTGDVDFNGHYSLYIVESDETVTIDPDGENRVVTVPAGNYILHSASSGAVTLGTYDTPEEARADFVIAEHEYSEWLGQDEEMI